MNTEQIIEELIKLVTQSAKDRGEQVEALKEAIRASDERITRVNDMVNTLALVVRELSDKYIEHIDRVADTRDTMIKQNGELIGLLGEMRNDYEKERERFLKLLDAYEKLAMKKGAAGTLVNVK